MHCSSPEAVTTDEIVAYVDGDAPPRVVEHIESCPSCKAEARRYARTQARLKAALHRFDCPSPQALGEYNLGLVSVEDRTRIAAHVLECPACADELGTLRAFLSDRAAKPEARGVIAGLRRIVATLATPSPTGAWAGLRGSAMGPSLTYLTEDLTISLNAVEGERPSLWSLLGLVVDPDGATLAAGGEAHLFGPSGESLAATVDELGNFAFASLRSGRYRLEVSLADRVVVLEDVPIDG